MAIDAENSQYTKYADKWKKIDDIIDQENLTDYLIYLNAADTSPENKARNDAYRERAVFYGLTSQTVTGMIGTMHKKPPIIVLKPELEYLIDNVDGNGVSMLQQSQALAKDVTGKSRAGLFTSFPKTDKEITRADVVNGTFVATISHISPRQVINWATRTVGSVTSLSLVVIKTIEIELVDYEEKPKKVIRELFIDEADGLYKERRWVESE